MLTYCCHLDSPTNRLYFGGNFTAISGVQCSYIAYLYFSGLGLTVNALTDTTGSNGLNNIVYSIRDGGGGGKILVGGAFTARSNGIPLSAPLYRVAYFELNTWTNSVQINNGNVYDAIRVSNNNLIIGGDFTSYDISNFNCNYIIGFNESGGGYFSIGSSFTAFNGIVKCLESFPSQSKLYVGGSFTQIDSVSSNYFTYFDTNNFNTATQFDFPAPCESIYYASNSGTLYRGGGAYVGITTNTSDELYTSPSPFSQGMSIGYKSAFYFRDGLNKTYIVTQSGATLPPTVNGAYIYEPVGATVWSSPAPIFPNITLVSAAQKGAAFMLIGTLVGTAGWYVQSSINCSFT